MIKKKSKLFRISMMLVVLFLIISILIVFMGRKPFKNIEITSASVQLLPPDETIQIVDVEELEELLKNVIIYKRDDSFTEYTGQAVVFTITKNDSSTIEVTAYNPFIIIDGKGYKCKYEPCEKLNSYANELWNNQK